MADLEISGEWNGIIWAGVSMQGKRGNNQDCMRVYSDENFMLVPVVDGMGSYSDGEVAAKIVADGFLERMRNSGSSLSEAAEYAGAHLQEHIRNGNYEKGTEPDAVADCVLIRKGTILIPVIGHLGDTRTCRITASAYRQLTKDDTVVVNLREKYRRTDEMIRDLLKKRPDLLHTVLASFCGEDGFDKKDFSEASENFEQGDYLLVSTDGLHGADDSIAPVLTPAEIAGIVRGTESVAEKAGILGRTATEKGDDNVTLFLAHYRL